MLSNTLDLFELWPQEWKFDKNKGHALRWILLLMSGVKKHRKQFFKNHFNRSSSELQDGQNQVGRKIMAKKKKDQSRKNSGITLVS